MNLFEIAQTNLLSAPVLGFLLGFAAQLLKSDLRLPKPIYDGLAIYLLFAIGLKGGVQLASSGWQVVVVPMAYTAVLGALTALTAFLVARWLIRVTHQDAASLAAHFGSVSAVTFIVGTQFLQSKRVSAEPYFPALVAVMEIVGILIAIVIAHLKVDGRKQAFRAAVSHAILGQGIFLLMGGFLIGYLTGPRGLDPVAPVFIEPFTGLLTLFLLEMGILAAERIKDARRIGFRLLAFSILLPLAHGFIGTFFGTLAGLSTPGVFLMSIMAASASYIAAPAAVRAAIPKANLSLSLTAALGMTFPFNITLGIPLYYGMAVWWTGAQ